MLNTSGRAGGLSLEPLKGAVCEPLKRHLHTQFQLIITFIFLFLISDIRSDHLLVQPNRGYEIPTSPETFSREIPSSTQLARYCYRTFTFDKTYYMRHQVLGWNTYTHVNVIQHQMAFHNRAFLLICQIVQRFPYMLPELAKYQFLSPLRNKYHMIFTIPACMTQTLVLLHF